ncbi:hypothetical protein PVAND_016368 [Polypedilum vanderplanki]|uniref:Uncharacterized protein n=1 Tax=Polypedilum vanderplanki TaxID=319348 RepID=A0A9J6BEY6_POLVA|nr:hypothetical protein PVAND_016368 [Polypedilum vanderplanki]
MKTFVTVLFCAILLVSSSFALKISIKISETKKISSLNKNAELFNNFLKDFNIELSPDDNFEERLAVFMENYRKIQEHNKKYEKGLVSFSMGLNQFTHLREDEMANLNKFYDDEGNFEFKNVTTFRFDDENFSLPKSFDWKTKGVLQPVQDQKNCGSCYVFAGIAAIEAQMMIQYKNYQKLSEQEAMECLEGCSGGYLYEVLQYSHDHMGCASGKSYPYKGRVFNSCSFERPRVKNSKVKTFLRFQGEKSIMQKLVDDGPVIALFSFYPSIRHYHQGIYEKLPNEEQDGYHAILIVGYDEDSFGRKYWIIRNSWGPRWGESGYFKMKRGVNMFLHSLLLCGGSRYDVMKYSITHKGCASGKSYPFKERVVNSCSFKRPRVKNSKVKKVFALKTEKLMMQALVKYGPISAGLIVYPSLNYYKKGIYEKNQMRQKMDTTRF